MSKVLVLIGIIFVALLVAGCAGSTPNNQPAANNSAPQVQPVPKQTYTCPDGTVVTSLSDCPKCPSSCNDQNPCTRDYCDNTTNLKCAHEKLTGNQTGCTGMTSTCMQNMCYDGTCKTEKQTPFPQCNSDAGCNDSNNLTNDKCMDVGNCNATCVYLETTECKNKDGVCPKGCNVLNDDDCAVKIVGQGITIDDNVEIRLMAQKLRKCDVDYKNSYLNDLDLGYYYTADIEVTNNGKSRSRNITRKDFTLIDSAGRQYVTSTFTTYSNNNEDTCLDLANRYFTSDDAYIYPGITKRGYLLFDLGKSVGLSNPLRLIYDPSSADGDEVIWQFDWK